MKTLLTYIKTSQRFFAFAFLILFPFHTIFIYSESFLNGYKWENATLGYYGIEVLGWGLVVSLLIPMLRRAKGMRGVRVTTDRLFLGAALAFLVYSFLSRFWSTVPALVEQQTLRMMLMLLVFISLPAVLSKREMILSLAAGAVLPIGVGLYQFFSQTLPGSTVLGMSGKAVEEGGVSVVQFGDERWLRAYGTFAHPNVFGGYLVLVITTLLVGLKETLTKHAALVSYVLLLLAGATLILTMSRSAWLAVCIAVVYLSVVHKEAHQNKQFVSGVVSLGMGVLFATIIAWPLISVRIGVASAHEMNSIQERANLQHIATEQVAASPILGVGAGNITAALVGQDATALGFAYQPVHNVFLLLLAEYGIVGVLLLILTAIFFLRWVSATYGADGVRRAGLAGLVLLPILLFDHYLHTAVHGLGIGAMFLAILLCPNDSSRPKSATETIDEA